MNTEKRTTETYVITGFGDLDAVTVYVTNYKLGQGKLVIECYGEAWAHYWGAMGDRALQEFVLKADNTYLAMKLIRGDTRQTDFNEINELAHKRGFPNICVTSDVEVAMMADEMAECFGGDWMIDLPQCYTTEYHYLGRILNAVKAAFNEERVKDELLPDDRPFKDGDLVTRTGADIHRATDLGNDCFSGEFECLYDTSGIYVVGEVESNLVRRYQKITEQHYPHLLEIAMIHGWDRV